MVLVMTRSRPRSASPRRRRAGARPAPRAAARRCRRSPGRSMVWLPGVASQSTTHWRQVSPLGTSPRRAGIHAPSSILTSTCSMPRWIAQATPPIGRRAGREVGQAPGRVDAGEGLERALLGVAPCSPVGVVGVEGGELELGEPLGRRVVAVEAGDDEPGGEAVVDRQGLAVHADGDAGRRGRRGRRGWACRRSSRRPSGSPADRRRPARRPRRSRSASGTPSQRALPAYGPPTSLEMHTRVMSRSTSVAGRAGPRR